MTTPPVPAVPPPVPRIVPQPGTRLAELQDRYPLAKAQAAEAESALKDLKAAMAAEALHGQPEGTPAVIIAGTPHAPELKIAWHPGRWDVDGKRMKNEDPGLWAHWARQARGYWGIDEIGAGS
jgi:hypothetical protein